MPRFPFTALPLPLVCAAILCFTPLAQSVRAQCTPTWELRVQPDTGDDLLALGDICYDTARDRIVLFGHSDFLAPGETWEFDGGAWMRRSNGGPLAIGGFGIAYDEARSQTVLFGGSNLTGSTLYADTWLWDGTAWTLAPAVSSPPPRTSHATAYDRDAAEIVVHGGLSASGVSNQTWGWNGLDWTLRGADGPTVVYARMAYDRERMRLVLFGGSSDAAGTLLLNQLWERPSSGAWELVPTSDPQPAPRVYFAMTFDEHNEKTVVIGGDTPGGLTDEVWTWDGAVWQRVFPIGSPKPTPSPALIFDPRRWVLYLHRTDLGWELREFSRGDLNCDCVVNQSDIGAFVLALTAPEEYAMQLGSCNLQFADLNCDGLVTVADVGSFVNCVVNNDCDCL